MTYNFDSVIFDLDGTLWDTTDAIWDCWAKTLSTLPDIDHIPTKEELDSVMGLSDDLLMKQLFPKLDAKRAKEVFDLCCEEENKVLSVTGAIAYEGITETLKKLSEKYPLSIVSNCNDGYIEAYLASMGTEDYISDYESYGRTGHPKSENIKDVVLRNGYKKPLYVGDTVWDKQSAEAAGVPFAFAAYGFGELSDKELEECVFILDTPSALCDKLL